MSEARPLRTTGTDTERLLLAAGSAERPDPASMHRTAEALGLLPKVLVVGAALALALRSARWAPVIVRGLVPLASVVAVAVVVYQVTVRPGPAASTQMAASAGNHAGRLGGETDGLPAEPRASEPAADFRVPFLAAPVAAGPLVRPADPPPATPCVGSHAIPSKVSPDNLGEQAELIDRARARIAMGDPGGGIAVLDDYDRRFAGAPLSEESRLLRIEALVRRGDRNAASVLGRQFLKTYPASVHAARMSALLHSASP